MARPVFTGLFDDFVDEFAMHYEADISQNVSNVPQRRSHPRSPLSSSFTPASDSSFHPPKYQRKSMDSLRSLPRMFLPDSSQENETKYLTGLKGIFAIQSFIWVYLRTFVPTMVEAGVAALNVPGPEWQVVLRKTLSVLFWNENLIYSAFILLSARSIAIPFIANSTGAQVAGSQFRRSIRFLLPVSVSLAIVYIISSTMSPMHLSRYRERSGNTLIETPYQIPNALVYFNSIFNMFWITNEYFTQAASLSFPTQTLWIISVVFQQSFTVYMTMVIIPYTRASWRLKALPIFILSAFWVQSWAWFSITGLMVADVVHNMDFKRKAQAGIPLSKLKLDWRLPTWVACVVIMGVGLLLQYLFIAWRPEYQNVLLEGHAGLYYSGGLNTEYDIHQPQARDDNYLILVGLLVLVESYEVFQWVLRFPLLVYMGRRALSWFLVQSILAYTAGIVLCMHLTENRHVSVAAANFVCLLVLLPTTIVSGEVFYQLIDRPSQKLAREGYKWIKS